MFDQFHPDVSTHTDPYAPLRQFAETHRDALHHAAERLGGRRGTRLALDALDGLSSEFALSRRSRNRLLALHELLSLEHVHDEAREEASRFASIDPSDPVVEEICALADGMRDALDRVAMDHRSAPHLAAA